MLPIAGAIVMIAALVYTLWSPSCHRCARRWAWRTEAVRANGRSSRFAYVVLPLCRRCAANR